MLSQTSYHTARKAFLDPDSLLLLMLPVRLLLLLPRAPPGMTRLNSTLTHASSEPSIPRAMTCSP